MAIPDIELFDIKGSNSVPYDVRVKIFEFYRGKCKYCGVELHLRKSKKMGSNLTLAHVHHKISIYGEYDDNDNWIYGLTEFGNLVLLCPKCHCNVHMLRRQRELRRGINEQASGYEYLWRRIYDDLRAFFDEPL